MRCNNEIRIENEFNKKVVESRDSDNGIIVSISETARVG
jgi:hypothetical protein